MHESFNVIYRINKHDEIVYTNTDWGRFALENDAPEMASVNILHQNFWNFLSGDIIAEIYRVILKRVRGGQPVNYEFRCDTSAAARILQMNITMLEDEIIQFETVVIKSKNRALQKILDRHTPRTNEVISMCSWCNRINIDGAWSEIEEAIPRLRLFDDVSLPQITHGMCDDCYKEVSRDFFA